MNADTVDANALISTERTELRSERTRAVETKILERFGKTAVFDRTTGQMNITEAQSLEDPRVHKNMLNNCNAVSRLVQDVVHGDRFVLQANGENPTMAYHTPDGGKLEIASGHSSAFHAFVVDSENKVWDPITGEWGEKTFDDYAQNISLSGVSDEPTLEKNPD